MKTGIVDGVRVKVLGAGAGYVVVRPVVFRPHYRSTLRYPCNSLGSYIVPSGQFRADV